MDSTKTKLLDQQTSSSNSHNKNKPFIFFLLILLSLLLLGFLTLTLPIPLRKSRSSNYQTTPNPNSDYIRTVCSFAPYKGLCKYALSSARKTNNSGNYYTSPETTVFLSFQLAITQLIELGSLPKTLLSNPYATSAKSALIECDILFNKEVSRLNDSVASAKHMYYFSKQQVEDYVEQFGTVATHQQWCLDKLEESGGESMVKFKVQKSRKYMSNVIAILSNIDLILHEIYRPGEQVEFQYTSSTYSYSGLSYETMVVCYIQYSLLILLFILLMFRLY